MARKYSKSLMKNKGFVSKQISLTDIQEDKSLEDSFVYINHKVKNEVVKDLEILHSLEF